MKLTPNRLKTQYFFRLQRFATTLPANATSTVTCAAGTAIACAASASVKHPGRVTLASAKKISLSANLLTRQVGIFPFDSGLTVSFLEVFLSFEMEYVFIL